MALTDSQTQALVILEVGEVWLPAAAPGGQPMPLLATNMSAIWDSYADKGTLSARLQELYAKRRCIDIVLATVRDQVDFGISQDFQSKQGQRSTHLQQMRTDCQAEIDKLEQHSLIGRAGAIATITRTEPETPPDGTVVYPVPDGNDPRYRGDLYTPVAGGLR